MGFNPFPRNDWKKSAKRNRITTPVVSEFMIPWCEATIAKDLLGYWLAG
jgi:hypothetical protein